MIKYKTIQRVAGTTTGTQAILLPAGSITSRQLAKQIEAKAGIPAIRVMDVISAIAEQIIQQTSNGVTVQLDGIGNFKPKLTIESGEVKVKGLQYYAVKSVVSQLQNAELTAEE